MHRMTLACPTSTIEVHEASFDLCSKFVLSPLQFPDTQILFQVEKGTCLWSGFLHRHSIFL